VGDFPPFTSGSITKTDNYIRKIVARLSSNATLLVEGDFTSYGSGFASYVEVRVSKKDRSDTSTYTKNQYVTYNTTGLLLYISRLTPYWFYGGSDWAKTYDNGQLTGGGRMFLDPASQETINQTLWQHDRQRVAAVLQEFRYSLLTPEELREPAPAGIYIPTELAKGPYTVFDCFFYWQD
jgi:hypothetical protein